MDPRALGIPVAFIVLAASIMLLLIGTKWRPWQKLVLIVLVPSFGLVVWDALESHKGWPTVVAPPPKALILWGAVREPDPRTGDRGAIFLWLTPRDDRVETGMNPLEYVSAGGEPRAYVVPYSRQLHKGVERAKELVKKGRTAAIDLSKLAHARMTEPGDDAENGEQGRDVDTDLKVYELPPRHPPRKDPP